MSDFIGLIVVLLIAAFIWTFALAALVVFVAVALSLLVVGLIAKLSGRPSTRSPVREDPSG